MSQQSTGEWNKDIIYKYHFLLDPQIPLQQNSTVKLLKFRKIIYNDSRFDELLSTYTLCIKY